MTPLFPSRPLPLVPLLGRPGDAPRGFPVHRVFCVGRNYAAHAAEMGGDVPEAPFWFTKSPFHAIPSDGVLPYPPGTADLHHEVELVVALGEGGAPLAYGVGLDMTRRDLQARAKDQRRPWDVAKDFEGSAVLGRLTPMSAMPDAPIRLTVNGAVRQEARLADMVHDVAAVLAHLATLYRPGPGDLVMTGTPAGVGAVVPGDVLEGTIEGLDPVRLTIGP